MGETTKISWTRYSASPWHGCAHKIEESGRSHPGCDHCYAEGFSGRNPGTLGIWGETGTRVKSKSFAKRCDDWNAKAKIAGMVYSVFPSLCDPFEDRPELVPWRYEMFQVIDRCPNLRFLLLTKRPENIRRMWPGEYHKLARRRNVCLGTSISDQISADLQVPELGKVEDLAEYLFLSCEPLLGPINLGEKLWCKPCRSCIEGFADPETNVVECRQCYSTGVSDDAFIDGIITGGESGPKARICNPVWVSDLQDQCRIAGVDFFHKQWGEWLPYEESGTEPFFTSQGGDLFDSHQFPVGLVDHQPIGEWYAPELDGVVYRKVGSRNSGNMLYGEIYENLPWDQS